MMGKGGDCHPDGVRHLETEVVAHAHFFTSFFSPEVYNKQVRKVRSIISLLFPCFAKTNCEIDMTQVW